MSEERDEVQQLVARARAGEPDAFEALYRSHQAGIYTFVRSQVGEPELAADLTLGGFGGRKRGPAKPMAFPAILHGAFRAPDGREAMVMVNHTLEPRTASRAGRTFDLPALTAQLQAMDGPEQP